MRNVLVWIFCAFFLLLPNSVAPDKVEVKTASNLVQYSGVSGQLRKHSVIIEVLVPAGRTEDSLHVWQKIGSGTLVMINKEPNILTAWHVAEAALKMPMRVCPVLEERTKCKEVVLPWMTDMTSAGLAGDWALFQLLEAPEGMTPARLRHKPMRVGEAVYILGSPATTEGMLSAGIVSGFEAYGSVNLIMTDAFAFFGSSGGGLYDANGYLIGVVVALSAPEGFPLPHVNYSVPVTRIQDFLKQK